MDQRPFILYKSSAGSGKTYTLTLEYLKLALQSPRSAYKQILAVTFTNKATQEMKERILQVLERLGKEVRPGEFLDGELMKALDLTPAQLQARARETLLHILHGYGYFAVSTIDSFFQRVIRSFAREMDLQAKFDLEMDTDAVLDRLVDRVVEKITTDKNLRTWLIDYASEQIENEKTWDIRSGIKGLGREIFQERFKAYRSLFHESVAQPGFLADFRKYIREEKRRLIADAEAMREKAEAIRANHGLEWSDFSGGGGTSNFVVRLAKLGKACEPFTQPTEKQWEKINGVDTWFTGKKNPNANAIINAADAGLRDMLLSLPEKATLWNTVSALQKNLNAFGVFRDLILELRVLKDEESILLISDVNEFLQQITQDNDAPFVYEKIGNQYRNFLIDEFQDTSDFQWTSFKPLLENSLASGNTNLLVGDVKQSIYRWRGGKLELLLNEVQSQFHPDVIEEKNLATNFRSLPGIIQFNNAIFASLPALMQEGMATQYSLEAGNLLVDAFKGVGQSIPEKKLALDFQGKIKLSFRQKVAASRYSAEENEEEEEESEEEVLEKLPGIVMELQDRGYALRDIAFLVRKNSQGAEIADQLMAFARENPDSGYRFDVLSEESLFLDKSAAVKCLVALLTFLVNPADKVALKTIWLYNALIHEIPYSHALFHKNSLPEELRAKQDELLSRLNDLTQLPLLELLEECVALMGLVEKQADLAYVSGFKEAVFDFVKKNRADLVGFLDWWELNKKKRTVKIPEDHDAMRILTIHKSKGLQYKVVLMPFLDWKIVASGQQAPVIWSPFATEEGLRTVMPLTHGTALQNSAFAVVYEDEIRLAYLDSLNMLYVAFTRAEEVIWGFSDFSQAKDGKISLNTTGNLLYSLFSSGFKVPELGENQTWDAEQLCYEAGKWGIATAEKEQKRAPDALLRWESLDWRSKLKTKKMAWDFSESGLQARSQRKLGVIVHELLAASRNREEAALLLQQYEFEGRLDAETATLVGEQLAALFALPEFQRWFDPSYQSLAEQGILLPGGSQKRPDRILIGESEVLVVDFKTGEKYPSHLSQVKEYMALVASLSQKPVKGYLCYLEPTEILEV
ncbi:UvrD-helicase domain-containing protein [Algoriphagus sp. H41]|uniref:DNA 3'-5' helicase n=1 Tax=Algoriphagus oliviformis TaxID=2811231 RepID=A0ABS3C769_9BACT|nr:UvrD-helicase domain-containing protein [Algoriphagus oliviformis]MBN7812822.1 UvrD-helicase domain-containing protein [Algoriphagus oliviformis]